MREFTLSNISWIRTNTHGYVHPCVVVDDYTIKFLLCDKVLKRRDESLPPNHHFWDDRFWASVFMKELPGENSCIFFYKIEELFSSCLYFSNDSDNEIIKYATNLFLETIKNLDVSKELIGSTNFSQKLHEYIKNIKLTEDELKKFVIELETADKKFVEWYNEWSEENIKGIDFGTLEETNKIYLKRKL